MYDEAYSKRNWEMGGKSQKAISWAVTIIATVIVAGAIAGRPSLPSVWEYASFEIPQVDQPG
ncbi:hypothetical protein AB8A28_17155 [Tardiphaga sp. 71_E8_N1_1]|jgi:hypothetical protein|uniref:hypothetical protein n=1 Tax=Tardiphaga sp. 71_E8_N1_1 TaxID=3240784 RepID=UPI000E734D8C